MTQALNFSIYVYLNGNLALDDRTATGIANAMRITKDKAGEVLSDMVRKHLLEYEKVGTAKVYTVANATTDIDEVFQR